jgi:hypothetical protein
MQNRVIFEPAAGLPQTVAGFTGGPISTRRNKAVKPARAGWSRTPNRPNPFPSQPPRF